MVGIPVGSSLVGFHPPSLLPYSGFLLPQEWIPDIAPKFPQHLLAVAGSAEYLLLSFVQPALAHHQMVFGLHIQDILSLQATVAHLQNQFAAYQQWIHSLFSLVSNNQQNSITSQDCSVTSIEQMHQSIPKYVRERLHEFHQLEQPWQTQVDSTLNAYLSNFEQLVQQLNAFSVYSFDQLQQVTHHVARGLCNLNEEFDQERTTMAAAIDKLQSQVNGLSMPKPDVPPSPSYDDLMDREQKLWDAIQELYASSCSQRAPSRPTAARPSGACISCSSC
ncbi:hypothetical protein DSO57_1005193 [Entomophthora muscae]|uniref:Uncharacterized protein n=1 Tax=Entomophthora muscae TaxID=34485 RepID=A0ACC2SKV9_9FUNG|nr:hypothetical protein DSO57_1005193 [Entomophthora muscae]